MLRMRATAVAQFRARPGQWRQGSHHGHENRKPPELEAEDLQLFVEALPLSHFILLLSVESALCTRDFTVETGPERTSAISSNVIFSSSALPPA